jgi:hypothetical protein
MGITDQVASVEPPPSVAVYLESFMSRSKRTIMIDTYIFLRQTNKRITWSHPTNQVELTPRGMTLDMSIINSLRLTAMTRTVLLLP